jgi:hypothetical protein
MLLAEVGPFFAVRTHGPGEKLPGPWRPLIDLLEGPALNERIAATRSALEASAGREVELKVAASVTQLGLAARLISPVLAARVLNTALSLADAWYQPVLGGPLPLSVTLERGFELGPLLTRLVRAVEHVSPTVLWGNVTSAVNGAVTMLTAGRPDLATPALAAGTALLRGLPEVVEPEIGPGFRRSSCCLIYRLAPGPPRSVCGDCIFTTSG